MDKLSTLLGRYTFNARVFFNGDFCETNEFTEDREAGHLHLVREGPIVFIHEDGAVLRVDEPSMVFYPRGMKHGLEVPAGATARLLCARVAFDRGSANPLAGMLPDCIQIPLGDMTPMRHTLDLLFCEASQSEQGREVILDRLCDVLMTQVIRHQLDTGYLGGGVLAGLADPQLAPVLAAIHARAHEPWQLQSLAGLACMSRAGFSEHFRTLVGVPPIEYLTRWRIGLACKLLRQGLPVKAVSAQAGYTSAAAFTRAFTEHLGVSPSLWVRDEKKGRRLTATAPTKEKW
jgi:AraC-like DNA-binding protein